VRRLDSLTAQRLDGTEGAVYPFWSPDSRSIGFFAEDGKRRSQLKKIDPSGGSPVTLCELPGPNSTGGTWNRNGVILFGMFATTEGEIQRVSAVGGARSPVTKLDPATGETRHWTPSFLPDGHHFLYLASGIKGGDPFAPNGLYVGSLDSEERKLLIPGGSIAKYADGHLLFLRSGFDASTLMAQPFDPIRLALTGEAVPIAERVSVGGPTGVAGAFSVSANGIVAYQAGSIIPSQLTWFDRHGKPLATIGEPGIFGDLQLSPDGSRAAITVTDMGVRDNADIWIYEVVRGGRTRFTFDMTFERGAVWSPDSQRLVFSANRKDDFSAFDLFVKPAIGASAAEPVLSSGQALLPESWASDSRFIAYSSPQLPFVGNPGADVWVLPLFGDGKPSAFLPTRFAESQPRFSPDGRWIAFVSNETGRFEVYVAPFPGPGEKRQISTSGGSQPRWRRDGAEIFYVAGGMLTAAAVNGRGARFEVGPVSPLFAIRAVGPGALGAPYDVAADGQRFLVNTMVDAPEEPVTLVVNWTASIGK
jgi:Tol biopolymer transport system component